MEDTSQFRNARDFPKTETSPLKQDLRMRERVGRAAPCGEESLRCAVYTQEYRPNSDKDLVDNKNNQHQASATFACIGDDVPRPFTTPTPKQAILAESAGD